MQKITTFITFEDRAEEAVDFYVSIFENSKKGRITRWGNVGPGPKGSVLVVEFQLAGQDYVAMNGGPHFKLSQGFSLSVDCKNQEEIDYYSAKLTAGGGQQLPCGWVTDKFGLSWQVNPSILSDMIADPDEEKADRAMAAMMTMQKIDIAAIEKAYAGE